jgi:hypothetical protein
MERFGFPIIWKIFIKIKRESKHQDKYHFNITERNFKMPLHQEFKLRNRWGIELNNSPQDTEGQKHTINKM